MEIPCEFMEMINYEDEKSKKKIRQLGFEEQN